MSEAMIQRGDAPPNIDDQTMLAVVSSGDCSKLNDRQKTEYYKARCDAAGLDPRSQPFEFVSLQGKLRLYATKAATDQLAAIHGVRATIVSRETVDGIHVVTVRVEARDGRQTEDVGALNIKGKQGDDLANAMMKTVTKAKRRAILSLCGLGMTDETELETIARAVPQQLRPPIRGVVSDAALPAHVEQIREEPPPAAQGEPPHDLSQGEDASEIELQTKIRDQMLVVLEAGFSSWSAKREWREKNKAPKATLPADMQAELSKAFAASTPTGAKE